MKNTISDHVRGRLTLLAGAACIALSLAGCGVHLYDQGLDNVAKETKAKADELDLTGAIATARANRELRVEKQVELIRRNKDREGDIRLEPVVGEDQPLATTIWGSEPFERRLEALGVGPVTVGSFEQRLETLYPVTVDNTRQRLHALDVDPVIVEKFVRWLRERGTIHVSVNSFKRRLEMPRVDPQAVVQFEQWLEERGGNPVTVENLERRLRALKFDAEIVENFVRWLDEHGAIQVNVNSFEEQLNSLEVDSKTVEKFVRWLEEFHSTPTASKPRGTGEVLRAMSRHRAKLGSSAFRLESRARRVEIFLGIMPTPCLPAFDVPGLEEEVGKQLLLSIPESQREIFSALYNDYRTECASIQRQVRGVMALTKKDGLFDTAWASWKEHEEALETLRADARNSLAALRIAERNFDAAAASTADEVEGRLAAAKLTLQTAVEGFGVACNLGASLSSASDEGDADEKRRNPFSIGLVCDKQRETLGTLVEALATGQDTAPADATPDVKRATAVAAALPGLVRGTAKAVEAGNAVPVSHLRLLKLQAEVEHSFAQRAVARQEARVRYARDGWLAAIAEAHHFWLTRSNLCDAVAVAAGKRSASEQIACETFEVTFGDRVLTGVNAVARPPEACRFKTGSWALRAFEPDDAPLPLFELPRDAPVQELPIADCLLGKSYKDAVGDSEVEARLKDAAAHFALAARVGEADAAEAALRLRAVDGDAALDADERALELWTNLIVVPVNSLAAYYAAGVKAESVAEIVVTGAALGAIAAGVN